MTCDEVRHTMYVYLDDEFAAPEAEAFRRHLDGCDGCRSLAQSESRFLNHVRERLPAPEMPEGMEARVRMALASAPAPEQAQAAPRSYSWVAAPLALAAGALMTLGAWTALGPTGTEDVALSHAVAAHQTAMPLEVKGGEESVRRFVKANAPFAAEVPLPSDNDLRLVGARLTQVDGRVAVIYEYDKGGQRVSVLQAVPQGTSAERPAVRTRLDHRQGYGVLTFGSRGLNNAVVGQLPEGEMRRLVPVSYRP